MKEHPKKSFDDGESARAHAMKTFFTKKILGDGSAKDNDEIRKGVAHLEKMVIAVACGMFKVTNITGGFKETSGYVEVKKMPSRGDFKIMLAIFEEKIEELRKHIVRMKDADKLGEMLKEIEQKCEQFKHEPTNEAWEHAKQEKEKYDEKTSKIKLEIKQDIDRQEKMRMQKMFGIKAEDETEYAFTAEEELKVKDKQHKLEKEKMDG